MSFLNSYFNTRLAENSPFSKARKRFGQRVVDEITNIYYEEFRDPEKDRSQTDDEIGKVFEVILNLQELVDQYLQQEELVKDGPILLPSLELLKQQIQAIGYALEEGEIDLPEILTSSIPLFRTIGRICAEGDSDGYQEV